MTYAVLTCRGLIGLVFAVSTIAKIRGPGAYREFSSWLAALPVPLARTRALPAVLVGGEAAIVVLVAVPDTAVAGLILAASYLAVIAAGTVTITRLDSGVACWCFGPSRSPVGARHLVRDSILLLVAVTGAVIDAQWSGRNIANPAEIVLSLLAALTGATFFVFTDDLIAIFEKAGQP
jgi:NADH:ubiquinone oxidoreductase subunit 2 (subunit N)